MLHTEELELIAVLSALHGERVLSYLHNCMLSQNRPLLMKLGMSLTQRGITGQTGPDSHRWRLYAMVAVDSWRSRFGFPFWWCHLNTISQWSISGGEVLYFGLKADVDLQPEVRFEKYLTFWTKERSNNRAICFPHSLDTGETEAMSTLECDRICEDVLASRAFERVLNSVHCVCIEQLIVYCVPLISLLMKVSRDSHSSHMPPVSHY